jgi:hypothetical protein|tara:strand:- start:752 stop:1063 length:312 start_codon:yes stop_codon:yes gene_type:complete
VDLGQLITEYGFPVVMSVGLGYFIYFIWKFIGDHIDPALEDMHFALIRVIDKTRMLDQDMIRLQQKVNVVLEYKAVQKILEDAKKTEALQTVQDYKNENKLEK